MVIHLSKNVIWHHSIIITLWKLSPFDNIFEKRQGQNSLQYISGFFMEIYDMHIHLTSLSFGFKIQ